MLDKFFLYGLTTLLSFAAFVPSQNRQEAAIIFVTAIGPDDHVADAITAGERSGKKDTGSSRQP